MTAGGISSVVILPDRGVPPVTAVKTIARPIVRAVRKGLDVIRILLLITHWDNARYWAPQARWHERLPLMLWSMLLRVHDPALNWVWCHAARYRAAHPGGRPSGAKVLHVAASFDLGGTQTQIKNLCTCDRTAVEHQAIEVFPEQNFLYRTGAVVDPAHYIRGTWWQRAAGRLVAHYQARSAQLIQIYKLYCDFKREAPDVVVGWGHEISALTFAAASYARVPHIAFCIRTMNPRHHTSSATERRLWRAHRAMTPMVSRVIVNSTLLRADHAAWLQIPQESIAVCHNGVSVRVPPASQRAEARAEIRRRFGIGGDTIVLLNIGRFSEEKGQFLILDANERLRAMPGLPCFVWLLFGDGPTLDHVSRSAAARRMDNVIFGGRTDAVPDALAAADIFVMPSDFEGMPNAMMEAMAFALPCVSTDMTGARDIARDGEEALYCVPRDAAALAGLIETLLRDPAAARSMGDKAAVRIQEFSGARACAVFDRAIESIVQTP